MGNELLVSLLLENWADINARHDKYGSALHVASLLGHQLTVRMLLKYKANVEQTAFYSDALQLAAFGGHREVVELLLENGAPINTHHLMEMRPW
jgi:ankyrin repeat protein